MHRSLVSVALFALVCQSTASAQVLRVGPGRAFATIPAALQVARSGQTLLVDPGVQPPFAVDGIGVHIVPSAAGAITVQASSGPGVVIRNLPASEVAIVRGVRVDWSTAAAPAVRVHDAQGVVVLDEVEVVPTVAMPLAVPFGAVLIERAGRVRLDGVAVAQAIWSGGLAMPHPRTPTDDGLAALAIVESDVVMERVRLRGADHAAGGHGGTALRVIDRSRIRISSDDPMASGRLIGGNGGTFGGDAVHLVGQTTEDIRFCGFNSLLPGTGPMGAGGLIGINGDHGRVVVGGMTLTRFAPGCIVEEHASVRMVSGEPELGRPATLRVWSTMTRSYATFASADPDVRIDALPALAGDLLLGLGRAVAVDFGTVQGFGPGTTVTFTVPNDPRLLGVRLAFQSVVTPVNGSRFTLSTGDVVVVRG